MRYSALGRSGLVVSRIILGSTMFGELLGLRAARSIVSRALDRGINTIDTANIYDGGRAEKMVGELVAPIRNKYVLCTKVGFRVGDLPEQHAAISAGALDPWQRWVDGAWPHDQGLSRKHIISAAEASLRRLQTDYIDLYQLHRWDPRTPIEETLRALDDLVRAGKVLQVGCSNPRSWRLYEALWTSERRGLSRFESVQSPYSLLSRACEADLLPACGHAGTSVIAYSVLAGGALSGALTEGIKPDSVLARRPAYQKLAATPEAEAKRTALAGLAGKLGRTQAELSAGFVLAHPAVSAATVGVLDPSEIDDLARAADRPLDDDEYRAVLQACGGIDARVSAGV